MCVRRITAPHTSTQPVQVNAHHQVTVGVQGDTEGMKGYKRIFMRIHKSVRIFNCMIVYNSVHNGLKHVYTAVYVSEDGGHGACMCDEQRKTYGI